MRLARHATAGLREFQDAFANTLALHPTTAPAAPQMARLIAQPGFAVYRNTVMKGCIDALQASYPAVARLVGDEWFRAAAALYVPTHLPRSPVLLDYGSDFADFLDGFEPARELPYLADVARLDRLWTEAHIARDEAPVAAASVAELAPDQLAAAFLRPHPSARWAWYDEQPIVTIWQRNRMPGAVVDGVNGEAEQFGWHAEGVLLTRPRGEVQWIALPKPACALLDACARGDTLADAAVAALEVDPHVDLAPLMESLLCAGAFADPAIHADTSMENGR